jgi:hypothetical protein
MTVKREITLRDMLESLLLDEAFTKEEIARFCKINVAALTLFLENDRVRLAEQAKGYIERLYRRIRAERQAVGQYKDQA